jgi:ABC-type multidrug transport system ATPase subunit
MSGALDTITVRKVSKRFGTHRALGDVDLKLRAGRVCALLGPNGAGKSTLLGILSTLVRPTRGTVVYGAGGREDAGDGPALRRAIGVLAHESLVYGELTAVENLRLYGTLYGVADLDQRIGARLDEVGLETRARTRPARTYSRGMTQRLALARALLHDPAILLLDEPFTGLDRGGAAALTRTIGRARTDGRIVLVVTHDFEALAGVCDQVAVLRRGKLAVDTDGVEADGAGAHGAAGHTRPFSYDALKDIYHRYAE